MSAALDGTRTHALLERCIKDGLADPLTFVGQEFSYTYEEPAVHARLSPSSRVRWSVCPGSVREEAKYPQDPPILADSFPVDRDRALRVKVAIDYIKGRTHGYGTGYKILAEERVDPAPLLLRSDMSGTVDVQLWYGDTYELIDYKDGMGYVPVEDNPQLELYALGVLSKDGLTETPFDKVRMTIIQPKLAYRGDSSVESIRSTVVPLAEMLQRGNKMIAEAAATDDPDAPLVPGEVQCKFCRAKGACSALAGSIMKEVGLMFSPVQQSVIPGLDLAQQSADKNPTEMTADQIRQVLEAAPLVRQFIEGVETEAQRRMEAGQTVPGYKLVNGRGSRSWALSDDEMADKLKGMGIPKDALYKTSLISPAQAEKVTWEKRNGEKKQLSERQLKTLETEYIRKSSGKLTIAPESDSRPAVITNAAPMFSPVALEPAAPALPGFLTLPAFLVTP